MKTNCVRSLGNIFLFDFFLKIVTMGTKYLAKEFPPFI